VSVIDYRKFSYGLVSMNSAVAQVAELDDAPPAGSPLRPFDVRARREIAHRRLVISMVRRFMRIVALHLLDGALIGAVLASLAFAWPGFASTGRYSLAIITIMLLSLNALSAYDPGDGRRDQRRLFSGVLLSLLILSCLVVFPPQLQISPLTLFVLGGVSFLALLAGREMVDGLVRQVYARGIGLRRALIIGGLEEVGRAIERLRDERRVDQYIEGHLTPDGKMDPTSLGSVSRLPWILEERDVQEVIVVTSLPAPTIRWVAEACFDHGAALYTVPSVTEVVDCRAEPLHMGACPLIRLHPARLEFPSLLLKRAFDLVIASAMMLVAVPITALIAIAIKVDSRGPVFFRQERVGLGGRRFIIWKFRSMCLNSEGRRGDLEPLNAYGDCKLFKLVADPRVTRVGRFLRRSSLDELPQLVNVLLGDMSLVGPRPPIPGEVDAYEPHHFERLTVVPGITGPWQVGGRNLITDFEKVVRMERAYIQSWSLLLDAKILLRTVKVVLSGEGAY
jgi:exopolysaccharide biosynthesis polyprenyl glycosylphosphotransferase